MLLASRRMSDRGHSRQRRPKAGSRKTPVANTCGGKHALRQSRWLWVLPRPPGITRQPMAGAVAGKARCWAAMAALVLGILALWQVMGLLKRRAAVAATPAAPHRRWWLCRSIAAVAALALAVVLLVLAGFTPFIPPDALPADNLFDFGHYAGVIARNIQAHNQYAGLDMLWNISQNAIGGCAAAGAAAVAAFAVGLGAGSAWGVALWRHLRR